MQRRRMSGFFLTKYLVLHRIHSLKRIGIIACATILLSLLCILLSWKDELPTSAYCDGELMQFASFVRGKKQAIGQKFSCEHVNLLDEFKISTKFHYGEYYFKQDEIVFVTYASSVRFAQARRNLVQLRNYTTNKIIFYDLGLTMEELSELYHVCNLEVRRFNFDKYPIFVRNLMGYHFKPIIMAEVFSSLNAFWIIDSSVRFFGFAGDLYANVNNGTYESIVLRHPSSHSIFAATEPSMFDFLPLDMELSKSEEMLDANTIFIKTTEFSKEAIKWNFLCAVTKGCMHPQRANIGCSFQDDRNNYYADCHRFDQSCINIIIINMMERNLFVRRDRLIDDFENMTVVERGKVAAGPLNVSCTALLKE